MAHIEIDAREIREFSEDISRIPAVLARHAMPVVERGALNIRNQLREEMGASAHFAGVARSISYDLDLDDLSAEIGPSADPGSPGNLANIAYFGSSRGGGGTVPDPQEALDAEAPNFTEALADLIEELL